MSEKTPSLKETFPHGTPIKDYFSKATVLHEIQHTYPNLEGVPGMSEYITRGLVLPARVTYVREDQRERLQPLVEYYRSIGVGLQEVRYLPGEDLFHEMVDDLKAHGEDIRSANISLFGQSTVTQEMIKELAPQITTETDELKAIKQTKDAIGLPTLRAAGTAEGIFNNKLLFRDMLTERLDEKGTRKRSMNVRYAREGEDTKIRGILNHSHGEKPSVIVKAVNQASGDAIGFCHSLEEVKKFIADKRASRPDGDGLVFIIEEDLSPIVRGERSAQFIVDRDYKVHFVGMTGQIIQENASGAKVVHAGNAISTDHNNPVNHLTPRDYARLLSVIEYAAAKWKYTGYVGLDLMDTDEGLKVLEANARIPGALPPYAILEQLSAKNGRHLSAVSINTIKPGMEIHTFEELKWQLGEHLYTPEKGKGVVPVLFSTLPEKIGLTAIGESVGDARRVMVGAVQALQGTSGILASW